MEKLGEIKEVEVEVKPVLAAQVDLQSAGTSGIASALPPAFEVLTRFMRAHGLAPIAPPRTIYQTCDPALTTFTVAFPIASRPKGLTDETAFVAELPGGTFMRFEHIGPYEQLGNTYDAIAAHLAEKGLLKSAHDWSKFMPMFEEYLNDPENTLPDQLRVNIYLPVR
ncbi:MAG TPA: GyrI-like domain-containing protein [Longimicrobiales bacterium]|nr:GyrI-like domain-containing protein [Longimicrobiales bacterium]